MKAGTPSGLTARIGVRPRVFISFTTWGYRITYSTSMHWGRTGCMSARAFSSFFMFSSVEKPNMAAGYTSRQGFMPLSTKWRMASSCLWK